MKTAVIVGIFGQDGQFLCNHLEKKEYLVIGIGRKTVYSSDQSWKKFIDISKKDDVDYIIEKLRPDEVYYLAACHHSSEDIKENISQLLINSYLVNVFGYINFLESILKFSKTSRIFYAASCHIFGDVQEQVQDESTKFSPSSIYAITKLDGLYLSRYFRLKHLIHSSVGILYNHESHLRNPNFVSRKIVKAAVEIKEGTRDELVLGDLDARIDWGYAGDYVKAAYDIMQLKTPDFFIIASGKSHSVEFFAKKCFEYIGLNYKKYLGVDKKLFRPKRNSTLVGNANKAKRLIKFKNKTNVQKLISIMMENDLRIEEEK